VNAILLIVPDDCSLQTKTKITINLYGIDAAAAILAADFPWVVALFFDFSLGGNVFCIILMFLG